MTGRGANLESEDKPSNRTISAKGGCGEVRPRGVEGLKHALGSGQEGARGGRRGGGRRRSRREQRQEIVEEEIGAWALPGDPGGPASRGGRLGGLAPR